MALALWEADVTAASKSEAVRLTKHAAEASGYFVVDVVGARPIGALGAHRWRIEAAVRPQEEDEDR